MPRAIVPGDQANVSCCKSDSRCVANAVVNVSRFERLRTRGSSSRGGGGVAYYARRRLSDVIGANEEIRSRPFTAFICDLDDRS